MLVGCSVNRYLWVGFSIYLSKHYDIGLEQCAIYYTGAQIAASFIGFGNSFLLKKIDSRFIHVVLGLLLPGLGLFFVGPSILQGILPFSPWVSTGGFLVNNIQQQIQVPCSNAWGNQNMAIKLKREPEKVVRDIVSNHVVTILQLSWFAGPSLYAVTLYMTDFQTGSFCYGILIILLGFAYLPLSGYIQSFFKKGKLL